MEEYRERLHVPLAWWLLAMPSAVVMGATLYAGLTGPWPAVILGGLVAGCAAILVALGRARIQVSGGMLRAGNAALPVTAIVRVVALDEKQTARLRGPHGDPSARLYSRPYLRQGVYLATAGESGYWLVGTRHPSELAAVIERCRVQADQQPVA